ncbi:MAG: hypothetical protein JWO86_4212 [Myxococcaceae bacterium]|nr:hypothetical protein [Myxococcaceae bacterium]
MLPFSKRPPPPDEYLLRSGDFEAVRQDSYSGAPPSHNSYAPHASNAHAIPAAPRQPVFARQVAQTPYGYAQQQQQQTYGSGVYGDLSSPPPPNSLAPVAMGGMSPDATARNFAHTTSRTNGTVLVNDKPSIKWGVMIALTGALLGGVLGLGMDARRQNARAAAAAADARDNAPPAMVAAALPNAPNALPNAIAAAPRPAAAPVSPIANAAPAGGTVIAPPAPAVLAAVQPVVVAPAKDPVVKPHGAVKPPPPKSHFLAAKVQTPSKPAPEKAEPADAPEPKTTKTAKVDKTEKTEKADPPATKTTKKDASTSDAMKILEAANKDTTNTL